MTDIAPGSTTSDGPLTAPIAFARGVKAKDLITGLEGIITARADLLQGSRQWAIQPAPTGDDKEPPKAHFIDEVSLQVTDAGISDIIPAETDKAIFKLGEEVTDKMTGFKGYIVEKVTYLNGCVHYAVSSKDLTKEGKTVSETFDCTRLTSKGKGFMTPDIEKAPASAPPLAKTGGPSRAVSGRTLDRR